jgi:cyclophilin family peptidyl-prolyl cis-trans isomerase/HEAT repeat protein
MPYPLPRIISIAARMAVCILLLQTACTPPESESEQKKGVVNLDLRNAQVQKLYNLRDQRNADSLKYYLGNKNATLRYLAALSFASLRDTNAIEALTPLLRDEVEDVRIAAAFSLGQIGHARAEKLLTQAFVATDSLSQHQRLNAVILEAIGKCGGLQSLKNIAAVQTYQPSDTLLLEGQCRAIYRFGRRDITDAAATAQMVTYVANERIPAPARLMAAHYLARTKDVSPDSAQAILMAAAFVRANDNPDIRMALAMALGKSVTRPSFAILSKVIRSEQDWRVKCNIINALAKFEYDTVRSLVTPFVADPNQHVSRTAATFFVNNGQIKDGDFYWRIPTNMGNVNIPVLSQIALFQASNKFLSGKTEPQSKDFVNYRLKEIFQQSKNPYERAACMAALAEFGWNYRWIHDKGFNDAHAAVKSAAAEALQSIMKKPNFYAFYGEASKGVRRELYYYLREIIASGDAGMIAAGVGGLKTEALNFKTLRDTARIDDFRAALGKLKIPRDVEAYAALDEIIAYFEGRPAPPPYLPKWNHPINWERMKVVTPQTNVTIETAKGKITMELYPEWAPGSVANFLELAATGFLNGKTFHRVVPNFVVQGGCPRGDGYGALDYTIRSEIGLAWYDKEGYLGMASAGPDTEGTQFFITHSPTPHLDGNYTIFGRVTSGMDIVNQLQPGDVIDQVNIQY